MVARSVVCTEQNATFLELSERNHLCFKKALSSDGADAVKSSVVCVPSALRSTMYGSSSTPQMGGSHDKLTARLLIASRSAPEFVRSVIASVVCSVF